MRKNGCAVTEPKLKPWSSHSFAAHVVQHVRSAALAAIVLLPLVWIVGACLGSAWHIDAWQAVLDAPLLWPAWRLTLWTGLASSLLAYALSAWLISRSFARPVWARVVRMLGFMLAVPHAAFAIGLMFLIAPSGWLLRVLSPWLTGLTDPPPWLTSQDPWGIGMIAVLVFKEIPFFLWAIATQLQRDDIGLRLAQELKAAQTMGYARQAAFWRVVWPQLASRIQWPLLAVLAYGLTVVDVAQIAGPSNPSTLSVLAWQWLQDADELTNAQGAVAGWLLAGTVALSATAWFTVTHFFRLLRAMSSKRRFETEKTDLSAPIIVLFFAVYAAVLLALVVGSLSGVWPFPQLLPSTWSLHAWDSVWGSKATLGTTLSLALVSTALALVWAIAWLESAPKTWDSIMRWPLYLPLLLPSVLWVVGLHKVTIGLGAGASWGALVAVHSLAVLPYVVIALSPAYLGFDTRYAYISASLGRSYGAFLLRVKWPMLRASIYAAAAVGVAVSVAQYLPTLYIGEGRFVTVTTEAVTLASGGQRSLLSAYAWLQWLIPVAGFGLAAWLGKPRTFTAN